MNRILINSYLKAAKKNCPRKYKKQLAEELENSLVEFCEGNENVTKQTIEDKFGNPKQYATEFISVYGQDELKKELNRIKKIRVAIIATIVLAALLLFGTVVLIIHWNEKSKPAFVYYNVSEGVVNENDN